jgi:hypothetical protein
MTFESIVEIDPPQGTDSDSFTNFDFTKNTNFNLSPCTTEDFSSALSQYVVS